MLLYKQITVDLYKPYPLQIMNAKQGDTARGALVTLKADGSVLVPTTEQIRVHAKKPDGTMIYNNCSMNGSEIQIDFTDQMLAVPGMLPVELEMTQGEEILSTPIFMVKVLWKYQRWSHRKYKRVYRPSGSITKGGKCGRNSE